MNWHYTTIQFEPLRKLNLSVIEYIVSDLVYHQSKGGTQWWSYSPSSISSMLGMNENSIRDAVDRCVEKGTLNKEDRQVISCQKFIDMVYPRSGINSHLSGRNSHPEVGETPAYYNNIYINKNEGESSDSQDSYRAPESEEYQRKPNTRKYPHSKEVFSLWGSYPKNWGTNTTQLRAAENLYADKGIEEIKNALEWYKLLKKKEFCPSIDSPYDLDSKWEKLERIVNKQP